MKWGRKIILMEGQEFWLMVLVWDNSISMLAEGQINIVDY